MTVSKRKEQRPKKRVTEPLMPSLEVVTTKKLFGKHLQKLLLDLGLTQSDAAAAIWGRKENGAAKKRDLISSYIAGHTFPSEKILGEIADGLRIPLEKLIPSALSGPKIDTSHLIQVTDAHEGMAEVLWHAKLPRRVAYLYKDLEELCERAKGRVPTYQEISDHFAKLHRNATGRPSA